MHRCENILDLLDASTCDYILIYPPTIGDERTADPQATDFTRALDLILRTHPNAPRQDQLTALALASSLHPAEVYRELSMTLMADYLTSYWNPERKGFIAEPFYQ